MRRKDPDSIHGLVRFPGPPEYRNTGEGGMVVFTVWRRLENAVCCQDLGIFLCGPVLNRWFEEQVVKRRNERLKSALERARRYRPHIPVVEPVPEEVRALTGEEYQVAYVPAPLELPAEMLAGIDASHDAYYGSDLVAVQGVVYLGSTGGTWWHEERGEYWCATRADLTAEGHKLVGVLDNLYGAEAELITVIDT